MKYELPTTLNIGGIDYKIRGDGDYRIVLDTFSVLEDTNLNKTERITLALCIFYDFVEDISDLNEFSDIEEAAEKMFKFFDAGKPEGRVHNNLKLLDWDDDCTMVCAAINKVANVEVRELPYLHWWTFVTYYMSIGESTLSTVVSIREKMSKGKKLEKWERDYRQENPEYFSWKSKTADDIDFERQLLAQWDSEG